MAVDDYEIKFDRNKYQVFIMSSPVAFPVFFFSHTWLVLNKKGTVSRYDVRDFVIPSKKRWGHVYLDWLSPFSGIEMLPFLPKQWNFFWNASCISVISGNTAKQIISFVCDNAKTYPHRKKYHYFGFNSNSFTAWVISKFPSVKKEVKLPFNAVGKGKFL